MAAQTVELLRGLDHIEGPAEKLIGDDEVRLSYLGGTVANRDAQLKGPAP